MNWVLAFNLDFIDPKPMSKDEAEKEVQSLASKASRQFTKGKTAYKDLNDALSSSYDEAVAALMDPMTQSAEAKRIVFTIISDEAAVFGSSVPQDQIANIKKAVVNKVKADYSLPVYKFLDGDDKDATEVRINEIIEIGIQEAGSHVAGEDEKDGYPASEAQAKYNAFQEAFASLDNEYSQINKSLSKLGMENLYALIGNGDETAAKTLPYATLQMQLQNLKGEFESGAEIENVKHLASNVFSSEANRAQYDGYLDLVAKEDILKDLEARSSNGAINPKLFMEAAMQFNRLFGDSREALLLLYGFSDSKGLETGTNFAMMESVFGMMNADAASEQPRADYAAQQYNPAASAQEKYQPQENYHPQEGYQQTNTPQAQNAYQQPDTAEARRVFEQGMEGFASDDCDGVFPRPDEWRSKNPQDYSIEDFYNIYRDLSDWNTTRKAAKQYKQETKQVAGKGKSKTTAGVLAILLGGVGAQKFYLGHPKEGAITILISVLGAGVLIGPLVMQVIGLVEGIKYLTKSPEDFRQTYELEGKKWF